MKGKPERRRPRLMIISPYSIVPAIHGGAVRMSNLIRHLSRTHEVMVLVMIGGTDDPEQRRGLAALGARAFFQQFPEAAGHPDADGFFSPIAAERIAALAAVHRADVVQLEYTELGRYVKPLSGRVPVVLVEHDIAFRSLLRRQAVVIADHQNSTPGSERLIRRLQRMEIAACRAADLVHVCSEPDRKFLASQLADGDRRLRVVANGVDTERFRPPHPDTTRRGILFVGSFPHAPNVDALRWFTKKIWPLVRSSDPEACLTVVGARPPSWVEDLDGQNGIVVAGEVEEVAPYYRDHKVMVAPIRAGSGTRLKILEAMAGGIPVVSTSVGAEGLSVEDGTHLLLADDPKSFAAAVLRLLPAKDTIGPSLAVAGREHVTKRFGWASVAEAATTTYDELAHPLQRRTAPHIIAAGKTEPKVSIIVHAQSNDGLATDACLSAIAEQQQAPPFEVLWTSRDKPKTVVSDRHRCIFIEIEVLESVVTGINRAAGEASGEICVVLDANALPTDSLWLSRLVEPFSFPNPPAAVAGSVYGVRKPKGRTFNPWFTAEARHWRQSWGDALFSIVNGAFRREVWQAFPLPADGPLADRRWQRQLHLAHHLVQPCLDAAVCLNLGRSLSEVFDQWTDEGHAWRDLGPRYRLSQAMADLLRCTGLSGTPRPGFPLQILPYLRPLALWAGGQRNQP